jgi:antitoxin (DNA-binding transcriptional repressor) of toxin-antitoxin stability system
MEVTITKLRQDLFRLADRARIGEPVQFIYKGTVFHLVAESRPSKLANLTRQNVVAPKTDLSHANKDLLKEMEAEWQKDWSEL